MKLGSNSVIIIIVAMVGLLAMIFFLFSKAQQTNNHNLVIPESTSQFDPVLPLNIDDHYKWKADSDITVINYYSIDCPHCRNLFLEENKYRELYERTFNLVYRPSPLPDVQPLSLDKAAMAECVLRQSGEESMFLFLKDVFTNYKSDQKNNVWVELIASNYVDNQVLFTECRFGEGLETVIRQAKQALADSVYGTPTIIVMKGSDTVLRLEKPNSRTVISTFNLIRKI